MAKDARPGGDHPVSRAVARARAACGEVVIEPPLWSMTDGELIDALSDAGRLRAQAEELELRLAREADRRGVGQSSGASSAAVAWAVATRQARPVAVGRMRLAEALERHEPTRTALAGGHLHADQARVIVEALDALPDDLDPALRSRAEEHLLIEATVHDAKALRLLGKRLLTVIAPDIGEAADARALEGEEREAAARAYFTMCPDGRGSMVGKFNIPEAQGQMLHKALLAFAAPKHVTGTAGAGSFERRPSAERLGDAFVELIERLFATDLPDLGGMGATVAAHIPLESLQGGDQPGWLDTGAVVSAAQLRRWACQAGILPAVLGGDSEVLDLGRQRRLFSRAQRHALNIAQPTCTTVGCDWPAYLCHAHHDGKPWAEGGTTDLADGRNLCPHHHARIHDPAYETTRHPDGRVSFYRRQ